MEVDDKKVMWLTIKPPRTPRHYNLIIVISVYYPPHQASEDRKELNEYTTNGLDKML